MARHVRVRSIACMTVATALYLTTAPASAYVFGNGFNLQEDTGLLEAYTVRLIDTPGVETLRSDLELAVAQIVSVTGLTVSVAPGLIAERAPVDGEILVQVDPTHTCGGATWVGCAVSNKDYGGPREDVIYQLSANLYFNTGALLVDTRHTVFHEMGHGFGLTHYNSTFEGQTQVMHASSHAKTSYQSGDINGLIYQRDRGAA